MLGGTLSIGGRIDFAQDSYAQFSNSQIEFYANNKRSLGLFTQGTIGGGVLHGVWYAQNFVHLSDRKLKTSVRPILDMLDQRALEKGSKEGGAEWVLRELRPVSYRFKSGPDSKAERLGFLADEMEETLPQVVRYSPERVKGIAYQDLIAVVVEALQSQQRRLEGIEAENRAPERHLKVKALEDRITKVELEAERRSKAIEARLEAMEAMLKKRWPDIYQV
jgi:hypothetical protein